MNAFFKGPGPILMMVVIVAVSGCGQSLAEKAEVDFLKTYADFKEKTWSRDSTRSGLDTWRNRLDVASSKLRQAHIQRNYHELAINGGVGKAEALIAARKMLGDPAYEQKIYSSTSELDREIDFAKEHVDRYTKELEEENIQADKLLPQLKAALERYEIARSEDAQVRGEMKRPSLKVQDAVEKTQSLISDEQFRRWNQEYEKSRKKGH